MRSKERPAIGAGGFSGGQITVERRGSRTGTGGRSTWIGLALLVYSLGSFLASCSDSLPPYEAPQQVIRVTGLKATIGTDDFSDPSGHIRSYVIFLVEGENNYDDTLQDTAHVSGFLEVWLKSDPTQRAVIPLGNRNISQPTNYRKGVLTIDPEEQFHLRVDWTMHTDSGTDILKTLAYADTTEQNNIAYTVPDTLVFHIELTLFAQVEPVKSDTMEYGFVGFIQLPEI